jgi:hypothetical protein
MDGLVTYKLTGVWGEISVCRPTPRDGDPWGVLAPLRDTPWGEVLPVVSGDAMSHALHGWVVPLVRELGPKPGTRKVEGGTRCGLYDVCITAGPSCHVGGPPPGCYEAPLEDPAARRAATAVALKWAEGSWVIVVEGKEWSLS